MPPAPLPLAITVSFPYVLKSPFLHSVENWIKCDVKRVEVEGAGCKNIFFLPGGGGAGGIIRVWR